jgi:hypothetical protein
LEDVRLKLLPCCSALEVLQEILELPLDEKLLSIALLWCCWTERNRGNHGEKHHTVDQFQFSVRRHVDEWKQHLQENKSQSSMQDSRWEAPDCEYVKINFDASFSEPTRGGGWGAICRDSTCAIQFAAAGPLFMIADAMHAEAMALSNAIQVAEQLGVGRVVFETDCLNLKQAINSSDYDYASLGILITDLKFRLRMSFIDARVVFTPRVCNKPAHELVALG